jgi:XTP/dITP diphosphohydrolase
MKKIVISSNNQNKIQEIKNIFKDLEYDVISYIDITKKEIDIEETGKTFEENAILKLSPFKPTKDHIFIADDSGLEVNALNGKPGIHSARYAGSDRTTQGLCQKLLQNMKDKKDRIAQFTTVIAILLPNGKIKTVKGIVKGTIINEMRGNNGFGYDPIFQPLNYKKTFAELTTKEKNKISHRYKALLKIKTLVSKLPPV